MGGAIATPHVEATRAGVRALERGGNALDAAVAAAAVLTVVYPHQTAIGGDVWAVVAKPDGTVHAVNGSGAAPAGVDVAALRARYDEMPDTGPVPVTVPGAVSAWEALLGLGARLGLAAAVEPAAALAGDGIPVSRSLAAGVRSRLEAVREDEGLREIFTDAGAPLPEGAVVRQPALARSLEQIAEGGAGAFYRGPIGKALVEGLRRLGSPIAVADLERHSTELAAPLELELDGARFVTAPPNSQGFVLLEMIAALGTLEPEPEQAVAATLLGMDDRDAWLGDPRHVEIPLDHLLDPGHASRRLEEARRPPEPARAARGDTVAVVAVDDDGCGVSLIQSVFNTFGAAILEPVTGIICQNRGRGFSLHPGAPNELAPGRRPAHTLTPLLLLSGDRVRAAVGTMGGRAQPQILLQILGGTVAGASLEETLGAPRWAVGSRDLEFERTTLALEEHAPEWLEHALARAGLPMERIRRHDERVGHAQLVRVGAGGLEAASDPRADGEAALVP